MTYFLGFPLLPLWIMGVPLIGALITPGRAPRTQAYGWIPGASTPTYVTSGIGTSILPVRFNCPPETVVLQLKGKAA